MKPERQISKATSWRGLLDACTRNLVCHRTLEVNSFALYIQPPERPKTGRGSNFERARLESTAARRAVSCLGQPGSGTDLWIQKCICGTIRCEKWSNCVNIQQLKTILQGGRRKAWERFCSTVPTVASTLLGRMHAISLQCCSRWPEVGGCLFLSR